jgi:hypothetical protein
MRRAARDGMRGSGGGRGMTRRQTLGAAGAAGAGLFLAGAGGSWAGLGGGDHERCVPVANAAVDIWQCNADGVYSDEQSENTVGQTYLRGIQFTDTAGWAELKTIYPGHYAGRATHIHVKVHIGGTRTKVSYRGGHVCHTGQLLFDESVTDTVYATSPYDTSTVARVPNAQDRIYSQQGGKRSMPKLGGSVGAGITAKIALGVDPSTTPAGVGM